MNKFGRNKPLIPGSDSLHFFEVAYLLDNFFKYFIFILVLNVMSALKLRQRGLECTYREAHILIYTLNDHFT